jgi:putative DNA primase/helicase
MVKFQEVAQDFLKAAGYADQNGVLSIRFWRKEFYAFRNLRYECLATEDLDNEINCWLAAHPAIELQIKMGTKTWLEKIKFGIRTFATVPSNLEWPLVYTGTENFYIDGKGIIAFQNGLLRVNDYLDGRYTLKPLTPEFLSFNVLPYDFDPLAKCPIYDKTLSEIFSGNLELQNSWHEWCGYHFLRGQKFTKFMILCGEGANGKSVLLTILRELLGADNCSSVSMSSFYPDSFALSTTYEKLGNLCSEMSDLEKISEQTLKQFVAGDVMQANRKGKPHIEFEPSAKLTFCCNNLPMFNDKTDGIWRRIQLIHFEHQIIDPKNQRPEFKEASFWRNSGEMPGIFNYALLGLARALSRGYLNETREMRDWLLEYRRESNPVANFLSAAIESDPTSQTSMQALSDSYSAWCKQNNFRPMNFNNFCKSFWRACRQLELPAERGHNKFGNLAKNIRLKTDSEFDIN